MRLRFSSSLLLPAALGATVAALLLLDRSPSEAAPPPVEPAAATAATGSSPAATPNLPPNHPSVPGMSPHGPHGGQSGSPAAENQEPAAITWTTPAAWQSAPNPNPMRLATYKVGAGSEMTVARAGGSVDANVQRWTTQFDGAPAADRSEKQVNGLKVTVVRIAGTFLGGGMTNAPEKHDGWAMQAAIVESSGPPYFFKLLGPADQVSAARPAFDALIASLAPRK